MGREKEKSLIRQQKQRKLKLYAKWHLLTKKANQAMTEAHKKNKQLGHKEREDKE